MPPCSGIRVAGNASFCTKRWVFSETLEKYTSAPLPRSTTTPSYSQWRFLGGERDAGQRLDPVRPEARPVGLTRHHDRSLQITQRHHVVTRLWLLGDVDHVIRDALLVQRLVCGIALHAGGLG